MNQHFEINEIEFLETYAEDEYEDFEQYVHFDVDLGESNYNALSGYAAQYSSWVNTAMTEDVKASINIYESGYAEFELSIDNEFLSRAVRMEIPASVKENLLNQLDKSLQAAQGITLEQLTTTMEIPRLADEIEQFMFERGEYDYPEEEMISWIGEDRDATTAIIEQTIMDDPAALIIYFAEEELWMSADDTVIPVKDEVLEDMIQLAGELREKLEKVSGISYKEAKTEQEKQNSQNVKKKQNLER